jgi:hypothetical protein
MALLKPIDMLLKALDLFVETNPPLTVRTMKVYLRVRAEGVNLQRKNEVKHG